MIFLGVTWIVDPYGVSPFSFDIPRVNRYKPKRIDIDRLVKPYEVWAKRPRTVFLGTSRIHQSIDPAVLDGTALAPAYNASIPASSLSLNVAHLRQYIELDPNLRNVYAEIFLYNFLGQPQERIEKPWAQFISNSAGLMLSLDALWASVLTVGYNVGTNAPVYEIKPGGYFYYPPGHNPEGPFRGYPEGIWKLHETRNAGLKIHEPAMVAFQEMIDTAKAHDVRLTFIYTPNHAYDDYYIDYIDGWGVVESWLRRLSARSDLYSFSQPNQLVYESVSPRMLFWNDPFHFSLTMGAAIGKRLSGQDTTDIPANFMVRLTPENIAEHIRERRQAVREWATHNPEFVAAFEREHGKWLAAKSAQPKP